MNRPQKLGEKLSELYDNEWTDAFEDLRDTENLDEKSIVQKLLEIFKVCIYLPCMYLPAYQQNLIILHVIKQRNLAVRFYIFLWFSLHIMDLY